MTTKTLTDARDEIASHIEEIERSLHWLSKKAGIPYSTIYSIIVKKERTLSDINRQKINQILGTDY